MNKDIPSHVGQIIKRDFLDRHQISVSELAREIKISRQILDGIINGRKILTVDVACRLSKALDTTPHYWLNFQNETEILKVSEQQTVDITPRFWEKNKGGSNEC